jgi:hypothetical protein
MVCVHTTHLAVVLSPLGRGESVTEYSAPQWGQKNGLPSGIGPVRGMSATPHTEPLCALKAINSSRGLAGPALLPRSGTLARSMSAIWSLLGQWRTTCVQCEFFAF